MTTTTPRSMTRTHPGSDTAKVRRALRGLTEQGITDRAARRDYAHGVRAKLAAYRAQGLLAP